MPPGEGSARAARRAAGVQPRVERDGACAVPSETLGIGKPKRTRPEGPQENSIPHVPFVEVDFVTLQEPSELILETQTFVMFGLRADVLSDFTHR